VTDPTKGFKPHAQAAVPTAPQTAVVAESVASAKNNSWRLITVRAVLVLLVLAVIFYMRSHKTAVLRSHVVAAVSNSGESGIVASAEADSVC
jgi:hypothetical protein